MDVEMETPLDVLSRAATMVQNEEREAALKRGGGAGESPVEDLQPEYSPSCKRLRESPPLHHHDNVIVNQQKVSHNQETMEESHRKCIATQTAFSSFQEKPSSPEPVKPSQQSYPSPPPYVSIDTSRIPWQPFLMNHTLPHSSLPGYQSISPLSSHHGQHQQRHGQSQSHDQRIAAHGGGSTGSAALGHAESNNMPLNLSVSSNHGTMENRGMLPRSEPSEGDSRNSSPGVPERLLHGRPMTTANGTVFYPNPAHTGNMAGLEAKIRRKDTQTELCDPSIEEHFRRSLGSAYSDCSRRSTSSSPPVSVSPPTAPPRQHSPPTAPPRHSPRSSRSPAGQEPKVNLVSVSGTVDDHFAKALGNQTWNKLKTQAESHSSVDDHFAKALGSDTWHQLQANNKVAHS